MDVIATALKPHFDRLPNLNHASRLDQMEQALLAAGNRFDDFG
jgi:hypothetical protein